MPRAVTSRYVDPLTEVWVGAARAIGLSVVRTADAYAATDGRGTLAIASDDALDADDSLGQMIFHELCHSLVEGEDAFAKADWGMDNTGPDHDWREHACLRVQWVLAGRHGLCGVFAPTTEFRAFWDRLSGDVLADRTERSVQAAIAALRRAEQPPWAPALSAALAASAQIAGAAAAFASRGVLWADRTAPPAPHPTGLPAGAAGATCGDCAWRFEQRGAARCRQADAKIDDAWPACERFEARARLPDLRRVLPRGVSLRRGQPARSGRQGAARLHRRSRHVPRGAARRRSLRRALRRYVRGRARDALSLRDLRRPPAYMPRLHAGLGALPHGAAASRAESVMPIRGDRA